MRKLNTLIVLLALAMFSHASLATDLACQLNLKPGTGGNVAGNGTANCFGVDFSFGNSTSGKFYLTNVSKPISRVIWEGDANCSGGVQCNITVRAYRTYSASAIVLYQDGTFETTNTATINYETGF